MATVTKRDLVLRIADRVGQSKAATADVIQSFIDDMREELAKGNRLEFREFGVFDVKTRAARMARNPQTGATVEVPARTVVRFRAGRKMKAVVAGETAAGGSHPPAPCQTPAARIGPRAIE